MFSKKNSIEFKSLERLKNANGKFQFEHANRGDMSSHMVGH